MFTAYCPELDIASCGHTPEEAKKNLKEVIEIQLEETAGFGTLKDFLADMKTVGMIREEYFSILRSI